MCVSVKTYSLKEVTEGDGINFNTYNIWQNQDGQRPIDYVEMSKRYSTRFWIDQLHPNRYRTLKISPLDVKWMIRASGVSAFRRVWLPSFRDEFETACQKYGPQLEKLLGTDKWFVRTEQYSLKYTIYGAGPYSGNDIERLLKALVTHVRGHSGVEPFFDSEDEEKTIYFLPWLELDPMKEFRLFIKDNVLTAISQQHLYQVNTWLTQLSEEMVETVAQMIIDHFNSEIQPKMGHLGNYIMDFVFLEDPKEGKLISYPIELNQFGGEYGAGSALFEWQRDRRLLYGDSESIEFRYVKD